MPDIIDFDSLLTTAKSELDGVLLNSIADEYDLDINVAIQRLVDAIRVNESALDVIENFLELTEERKMEFLNSLNTTKNGFAFNVSTAPDLVVLLSNTDKDDREKVNVLIADYLFTQVLHRLGNNTAE
jgi:hypothetical protein